MAEASVYQALCLCLPSGKCFENVIKAPYASTCKPFPTLCACKLANTSTTYTQVHDYSGTSRQRDSSQLATFDVIVVSYATVTRELTPEEGAEHASAKELAPDGLFGLKYRRVVLDEGHTISNTSSKVCAYACACADFLYVHMRHLYFFMHIRGRSCMCTCVRESLCGFC
jgi:hypothetical protein